MSKKEEIPHASFISEKQLRNFLSQVVSEEARRGSYVPGIDCRGMIRTRLYESKLPDHKIRHVLDGLVAEGWLTECRKNYNVVGYYATGMARDFSKDLMPASMPDNLAIREIQKMAKLANAEKTSKRVVVVSVQRQVKPASPLSSPQKPGPKPELVAAMQQVISAEIALCEVQNLILEREKELVLRATSKRSTQAVMQKVSDQITILKKRRSEEEMRLNKAQSVAESLVKEKE